jgi:hypothetical protein
MLVGLRANFRRHCISSFLRYPSFQRSQEGERGCPGRKRLKWAIEVSRLSFQMRSRCRNLIFSTVEYKIESFSVTAASARWLHTWLVQMRLHWQATSNNHRLAIMFVTFGPHGVILIHLNAQFDTEHHITCATPHFLSFGQVRALRSVSGGIFELRRSAGHQSTERTEYLPVTVFPVLEHPRPTGSGFHKSRKMVFFSVPRPS